MPTSVYRPHCVDLTAYTWCLISPWRFLSLVFKSLGDTTRYSRVTIPAVAVFTATTTAAAVERSCRHQGTHGRLSYARLKNYLYLPSVRDSISPTTGDGAIRPALWHPTRLDRLDAPTRLGSRGTHHFVTIEHCCLVLHVRQCRRSSQVPSQMEATGSLYCWGSHLGRFYH